MILVVLGLGAYALAGLLYSMEGAARFEISREADEDWDRTTILLLVGASILWPLAVLASGWYAGVQWRTDQLRKKDQP